MQWHIQQVDWREGHLAVQFPSYTLDLGGPMQRSSYLPTVHVGKVWRLMLADLGLSDVAVLRRAGLPSGLLDGDGSRITLDEFYALWESFDAEAQSPTLALQLGQIEASEFFDPAFFAILFVPVYLSLTGEDYLKTLLQKLLRNFHLRMFLFC